MRERKPFRVTYRTTRIDGSIRWMSSTCQPYFDQEGRPTHVIGTVHDITQRKLAEQWLQAQNEVLRSIALGVAVHEVFDAIVRMLRQGLDVAMVALLTLDPNDRLQVVSGVNVPDEYRSVIHAKTIHDASTLCSSCIITAEPLISEQLTIDPRASLLRPAIEKHGWGSCCMYPIMAASEVDNHHARKLEGRAGPTSKVAGLFAIYRAKNGRPDDEELERIAQAAHMAHIAISRDLSQKSLRDSEHRFRELANAMPQLVWINTPEGNCTYGNRLLKDTIGEAALSNWIAAIHPDERTQVLGRFEKAIQSGEPYISEHRLFVQNLQAYRWFLARGLPSRDEAGNIDLWYGTATDIDDMKRTEVALREERDRLTTIADICPSVLFTLLEQPDGQPRFLYAAPSIGELLGADLGEIQRDIQSVIERIEADDYQRCRDSLRHAAARMSSVELAFRIHHPTKGLLWIECQAAPCRLSDGQICWHGTLTDVTRRKMLEARLLQTEKLEAIGRLAGGVAHDFNNLLTVIISACHVLEAQLNTSPDDSHFENENLEAIRQSALRAASLTKQLLAFSRQQPAAPQQLNLNTVINQTSGILERLVGKSIRLETDLADSLKLVFVDPSQVEQILVNLVINSRDAIQDEGVIQIVTRNVTKVSASETASAQLEATDYVEICVTDNGCGMSQDTLAHAFDPFFTTKPVGKGTGLGLAVVHGIVSQNHGSIEVESQPGEGTTFCIQLPAIDNSSATISPIQTAGVMQGGTEGVLVVDDEPDIGKMTAKTLRSLGYTVFTADSPQQAEGLFELHGQAIDILLTDLLMPGSTAWNWPDD